VKAPSKEVKVARPPGPKLDVSANTTNARSGILTAGFSKKNQNAHPGIFCNLRLFVPFYPRNFDKTK